MSTQEASNGVGDQAQNPINKAADNVQQTVNKASKMLGFLKHTMYKAQRSVKNTSYKSLVRPVLEYCSVIWDPHQAYLQKDLESVQRKAARFVCSNYQQLASVTHMMEELGWPTLQDRRQINRLTALYKLVTGAVEYDIKANIGIHPHQLPRNHRFKLMDVRGTRNMDIFHFSFLPKTIREWNSLPKCLLDEDMESPQAFKLKLERLFGLRT